MSHVVLRKRYELVIHDIKGGVVSRERFLFRFMAERARFRANAHARAVVNGLRHLIEDLPAEQLYYAHVDRIGGRA